MFNRQSLHIALLLWGFIFCLIAALCMFMSKNFDKEKRIWLLHMQLACAILLVSDALAWGYRGTLGDIGYYMVRFSNFFVFLFSDIILFLFHGYVCCYLFGKEKDKYQLFRVKAVYGIALVGMALVVVSQYTGLYYTFDNNNYYHRSPAFLISMILPAVGMLFDLWLIVQFRRALSHQIFVSMLSYIALPLCATVVQTFYYGISLINIAISISMILMFVVATVEQNQMLARKEKEATDLRISIMMSQIAPHFIYNTLTSIQAMCDSDPKMAEETVGEFATYLRGNLNSLNTTEPVPFERELEHIRCYLAIEQKRFGDRVRVEYDVRETEFLIPALTLQPLVENAIKHGICKKKGGGTVKLVTFKEENGVCIRVEDDGVGFDPAKIPEDGEVHVGFLNVRKRLEEMCNGTLQLQSKVGRGTVVTIFLPKIENKTEHNRHDDNSSGR